jgi:hypothetical protein
VVLTELTRIIGRQATLDDIPDEELDLFAEKGFDWVWFLSVWTTGKTAQRISRENPEWRNDFERTLPDLEEEDIGGSGFAIAEYKVHPIFGGDEALKRMRERLRKRGLKLMLDFVPNHMGPDHHWVEEHPEYFISGTVSDLEKNPCNFSIVERNQGDIILAFGRDPYFSGWPDTVQLDYSNPATTEAMTRELLRIAEQCDGVRCDMAMLILPDVFEKTWGQKAHSFWPEAIMAIRKKVPGFCFMAEVYWDMEWQLQQLGFDYTYDKKLYDRLTEGDAKAVREHFYGGLEYQSKLARFLENHDEQRAASTFDLQMHKAAAVVTFLSPGLRFFHQGQFQGKRKRISPHLIRAPQEPIDEVLTTFYAAFLPIISKPVFRFGNWQLIEPLPAWEGNTTSDSFIVFLWEGIAGDLVLVTVNYSPNSGQCYLRLPFPELSGKLWRLQDKMSESSYDRNGNEMQSRGLYLDLEGWQFHIFEFKRIGI